MQEYLTLPYKRRIDIHGISVPFDQLLEAGESIVSGEVSVTVFTGIDLDPSHMIEGVCQVRGVNLYQQIKLGNIGVIYLLVFEATTDLDNVYRVTAKLAVVDDNIPAGPIYQHYYFTTPPYPINTYDEVGLSSTMQGALLINPPIDLISVTSSIVAGELRDLLQYYTNWPPEGFSVSSDIMSGELRDLLRTYTMLPEGVTLASDIQSGTLKDILITYSNYPPEGVGITSDIIAGTLT